MSDNGGVFNNEDLREIRKKLNTTITTFDAESPWRNGINEKHNAISGDMIFKVKRDVGCSLHVAVSWAVSAKHSPADTYRYSPNQLVFQGWTGMHILVVPCCLKQPSQLKQSRFQEKQLFYPKILDLMQKHLCPHKCAKKANSFSKN